MTTRKEELKKMATKAKLQETITYQQYQEALETVKNYKPERPKPGKEIGNPYFYDFVLAKCESYLEAKQNNMAFKDPEGNLFSFIMETIYGPQIWDWWKAQDK